MPAPRQPYKQLRVDEGDASQHFDSHVLVWLLTAVQLVIFAMNHSVGITYFVML